MTGVRDDRREPALALALAKRQAVSSFGQERLSRSYRSVRDSHRPLAEPPCSAGRVQRSPRRNPEEEQQHSRYWACQPLVMGRGHLLGLLQAPTPDTLTASHGPHKPHTSCLPPPTTGHGNKPRLSLRTSSSKHERLQDSYAAGTCASHSSSTTSKPVFIATVTPRHHPFIPILPLLLMTLGQLPPAHTAAASAPPFVHRVSDNN